MMTDAGHRPSLRHVLCVYDLSFLAFARLIYAAGPFIRFAYWCMVFPGFVFIWGLMSTRLYLYTDGVLIGYDS